MNWITRSPAKRNRKSLPLSTTSIIQIDGNTLRRSAGVISSRLGANRPALTRFQASSAPTSFSLTRWSADLKFTATVIVLSVDRASASQLGLAAENGRDAR